MTDISFPVKAINAHDFPHSSLPSAVHASHHHHYNDAASRDDAQEDDQISCVCGYADDDGWTVQCDTCNRWQHQLCYYPSYEEKDLPDSIEHYCIDCKPRHIDVNWARRRQSQKREAQAVTLTNGARRSVPKSHKKKKEPSTSYTNGWPLEKSRHDRNSDSPRDQPPPAKRPKTTHRTSDSTTNSVKGHSRKRNASTANHRRSMSRTPDVPAPLFSDEFLQSYVEDDWSPTNANILALATMNSMVKWLNGPDEDFRREIGLEKTDVYARWDGDLDDIPGKAQIDIMEFPDDRVQYDGVPLVWKAVTVKEPIAEGAYIGELNGAVEMKSDYQSDPTNRWAALRHPEPFVFFHSKLPLVIDARAHGNDLRYIRRSCTPNARLQILVTGGADYHFCFMATSQIEPGVEITIPWDTIIGLPELSNKTSVDLDYKLQLSMWVSNVLANCGPCACQVPDGDCKMSRFDRRGKDPLEDAHQIKAPKSKKRKAGHQISPAHTHAFNSRSGSEVRRVDHDDDSTHSRSTSGSASRDITPNTHYSNNGMLELSERERKKLAKEEEMFRRQEEERSGKQAKKKRNSAGSSSAALNINSTKSGFNSNSANSSSRYVDAGTSRQSGSTSNSAKAPSRQKSSKSSKTSTKPATAAIPRLKPVYVSTAVQCDMDADEAKLRAATPPRKRIFMPLRQRLLERCARNNAVLFAGHAPAPQSPSPPSLPAETTSDASADPIRPTRHSPPSPTQASSRPPSSRIEGVVVKADPAQGQPSGDDTAVAKVESPSEESRPVLDALTAAPLVEGVRSRTPSADAGGSGTNRPPPLHVDMPPPSTAFPSTALPTGDSADATGRLLTPSALVQTPTSLTAPGATSPSIATAPSPSPASQAGPQVKKMSLSEYRASRNKARALASGSAGGELGALDREGSPASTASGPVATSTLTPATTAGASSLPGSTLVEESSTDGVADVKMEDAPAVPPVAAIPATDVSATGVDAQAIAGATAEPVAAGAILP